MPAAAQTAAHLSTDFAVKAIKLTETIHGHRSIVNQLERSAKSVDRSRNLDSDTLSPSFLGKYSITLAMRNIFKGN